MRVSFELDAVLIARGREVAIAGPTVGDQGSNLVIVHLEMEQRPALFFQRRKLPHLREIESGSRECTVGIGLSGTRLRM